MSQSAEVQSLIEDIAYLAHELEALKGVIEAVPYQERPPGTVSILDMIARLREQQEAYYQPLIERTLTGASTADLKPVDESYTEENQDAEQVLNSVIEKRNSYTAYLKSISSEQWNNSTDSTGSVIDIVKDHILFDRSLMKEIAEIVLTLDKSRSTPQH